MAFHTDYGPISAAPAGTGTSQPLPEQTAVVDWEEASVRGWDANGQEVRVVNGAFNRLTSVGVAWVGDMAYAEKPDVVEKLSMGRKIGYRWLANPDLPIVTIGKCDTHRGIEAAWKATLRGNLAHIERHCQVIDTNGNTVPLAGW